MMGKQSIKGVSDKNINERFFDVESKAMWYVLGTFYPCYTSPKGNSVMFKSEHNELVDIIKGQLEIEHDTSHDNRDKSSHWVHIKGAHYLNNKLGELGLNVPKKQRKFPQDVPEEYIDHFIRGFIDAKSYVKNSQLLLYFNNKFLKTLNKMLNLYAEVDHENPRSFLAYGGKNTAKIRDFIYGDWKYIKKKKLYLPSKKALFKPFEPMYVSRPQSRKLNKNITKVKKLLLEGKRPSQFYGKVGYSSQISLGITFKRKVGMSITQWLEEEKKKQAKKA